MTSSAFAPGRNSSAKSRPPPVLSHPFANHAAQFNWALENIPSEAEWVLRIDADERIGRRQREELRAALRQAPADVTAFEIARRIRFLGRELRYGDTYPIWLLRIWRRGVGRCEDTWMDEHIVLQQGEVQRVTGGLNPRYSEGPNGGDGQAQRVREPGVPGHHEPRGRGCPGRPGGDEAVAEAERVPAGAAALPGFRWSCHC